MKQETLLPHTLSMLMNESAWRDGKTSYYLCDRHGNVRALVNEEGTITDSYAYDAYGNLLQAEGETKNDFLYTGEQYNATTGLYYLRARYMNPSTGTFISMDSYQGNAYDPVSLHKYLYANANPVMNTDPTGYFSISECSITTSIRSTFSAMHNCLKLQKIIKLADALCTVYDTAMEIRNVILGDGSVGDVIVALLKGVVVGFMVDGMCKTSLGIILKPMMALFGLSNQVDQIQEAIESGDPVEISVRFVQLICMLFGLTSQCFTGETLISTENGLVQISDINVGDYVWAENVETGEKELKQVLEVYVNETNTLVHVQITNENGSETVINTTENHPFYVESKGWVAASQLEAGDKLHTKDGKTEIVQEVSVEKLNEPVIVYNFGIETKHTYYVSDSEVLVHNACGDSKELRDNMNSSEIFEPNDGNSYAAHHIVASSSPYAEVSRNILDNLGIGINSKENGVFLPRGDFGTGANHNRLHTKEYYAKVNALIERAYYMDGDKKQNVLKMLELIGDMLRKDTF